MSYFDFIIYIYIILYKSQPTLFKKTSVFQKKKSEKPTKPTIFPTMIIVWLK